MNDNYDYIFKVIIIGDDSCGKTSLVNRFVDKDSPMEEQATIGVDFTTKYYTNTNGKKIKLYLWHSIYSIISAQFSCSSNYLKVS